MKKKIRILVCTHEKFNLKNNTDLRQILQYKEMVKYNKNIDIVFLSSRITLYEQKIKYQIRRIYNKLTKYGITSKLLEALIYEINIATSEIDKIDPSIILSYMSRPIVDERHKNIPIFHTAGFMTIDHLRNTYGNEDFNKQRLRQFETQTAVIKNVDCYHSHTIASNNIGRENFPDYDNKFFYAPFFLPNLVAIAEENFQKKWENGIRSLIFIGNQARLKRLDLLLKSWTRLGCGGKKNLNLIIVSNFSDGKIDIPNDDNIIIKSNISNDEVIETLQHSHILVLPSIESYGIAFIEAMASGCALIGSDIEVQREIIHGSNSGMVCDPRDISRFDSIINMMLIGETAKKFAKNGLFHFNQKFSRQAVANIYYKKWIEMLIK